MACIPGQCVIHMSMVHDLYLIGCNYCFRHVLCPLWLYSILTIRIVTISNRTPRGGLKRKYTFHVQNDPIPMSRDLAGGIRSNDVTNVLVSVVTACIAKLLFLGGIYIFVCHYFGYLK